MGPTVWILLLCAVSGILSNPTHQAEWNFRRELNGLFRKSSQSTGNCRQLSEAFGTVVQHSVVSTASMFVAMPPGLTENGANQILQWVFGFDIVNDGTAREQYTCDITESQTLSQLKQKLEDNELVLNVFRLLYDMISMAVRIAKQFLPPSALRTFWDSMESAEILGLDQNRVDSLADILGAIPYPRNYTPAAPYPGSTSDSCSHLTNAFMAVIRESLGKQDAVTSQSTVATIEVMTGLDITDRAAMMNFFCDLVVGARRGGQGLYDAFENNGVFTSLMRNGYPYVQIYTPLGRRYLGLLIRQHETPSPNQVVSQHSGVQGPANQEGSAPELLDIMHVGLEFVQELEASNLLRLTNDL